MDILKYEIPVNDLGNFASPRIFLAGPTVRGHQQHLQPSWRFAAIDEFKARGFQGSLIIPEFSDCTLSDKGRYDLPIWEYAGLKLADCILFWLPGIKELIGLKVGQVLSLMGRGIRTNVVTERAYLTTNFVMGHWMRWREKMVYGRPNDPDVTDYLDILWKKDYNEHGIGSQKITNSLTSTISETLKLTGV